MRSGSSGSMIGGETMSLQRSLAFAIAALAAVGALSLSALPVSDDQPRTPNVLLGDGARACSDAKSARWARRTQPTYSVASSNFDATYYYLDLTIDMAGSRIDGVVQVVGTVVGSPLPSLVLDLASTMTVSWVKLANGTPLSFTHAGSALDIVLPFPATVGTTVAVDVAYGGTPSSGGFGYFVFGTRAGHRFAWSLSEPYGAREWWPCKDHPSDKADSVRIVVKVGLPYRVGSQGILMNETSGGGYNRFVWASNYPISTYLVSIAAGEYVRYQDAYVRPPALAARYGALSMPIEDLVYKDDSWNRPTGWANVVDVLEVFEDWFGPYPFAAEKYGHAEFTFGGGMEHQTMSSMGASSMSLVTHELAHQWYGDGVSPKTWPHLWLNEGFATYGELVYWEERANLYPGWFESTLASRYVSARGATGTLVLEDTTNVGGMFTYSRVYAKGAIVLHMLRYVVGDSTFKDILLSYATDPLVRYGVATTADFKRVAETRSGLDLDAFFSQWVTDGTGYPTYGISSNWRSSAGGYTVWVTVAQTQELPQSNVEVFEMPLVIAVQTTSGEERFRVNNNLRIQTFELTVASEPLSVSLDPDKRILRSDEVVVSARDRELPSVPLDMWLTPNPSGSAVTLRLSVPDPGEVRIDAYDVAGRRVLTRTATVLRAGIWQQTLDTSSLATGVYFLRAKTPQGQVTRKLAVVR